VFPLVRFLILFLAFGKSNQQPKGTYTMDDLLPPYTPAERNRARLMRKQALRWRLQKIWAKHIQLLTERTALLRQLKAMIAQTETAADS
jgi:hypothetical protein